LLSIDKQDWEWSLGPQSGHQPSDNHYKLIIILQINESLEILQAATPGRIDQCGRASGPAEFYFRG